MTEQEIILQAARDEIEEREGAILRDHAQVVQRYDRALKAKPPVTVVVEVAEIARAVEKATKPIAEALEKVAANLADAVKKLASLAKELAEQKVPEVIVEAPAPVKREKRTLRITHDDGSTSTVSEVG